MPHTVYIVGAGPGDPMLLTRRAHALLSDYATVVVYDRLVPDAILAEIPPHVTRVYAGKSCRQHVMTQGEINAELVAQAQAGHKVVRLKGGDPFIFGRGGEECAALVDAGIPFEVVPGITAGTGIAARLALPLTHRGVASSVRFLTGHQQKSEPSVHDWHALADDDCTLVLYMGLAHLREIAAQLLAHGRAPDTPAVIVENGTMPEERALFGTLATLADNAEAEGFSPPCTVIVGKVVSLAHRT